jgi:hypothetical protein
MNATMIEWNHYSLDEPTSLPKILLYLHGQVWEYDKEAEMSYVLHTSVKSYNVTLNNTYIDVIDHDLGIVLYQARLIGNPPVGILRLYEDEGFYDNMLLPKDTHILIESEE